MQDPNELKEKLRHAINYCSAERFGGDTPDFILAELLVDVLAAVGKAVTARDEWFGFKKPYPFAPGPLSIEHGSANRPSGDEAEEAPAPAESDIVAALLKSMDGKTTWMWSTEHSRLMLELQRRCPATLKAGVEQEP